MIGDVTVWWQPHPLGVSERRHVVVPEGARLADALEALGVSRPAVVRWNGEQIDPAAGWLVLTHGVVHVLQEVPEGGQAPAIIQGVMGAAMIIAGAYTGNYYLVAAGAMQVAGAGYTAYQTSEAEQAAKYGKSPAPKSTSLAYDGLRNRADPYGAVPRAFGRARAVPPYAAIPYTEISGHVSRVMAVFALSYGPTVLENVKIGETPLAEFSAETQFRRGYLPWMITNRGGWAPSAGLPADAAFGDRWTVAIAGTASGRAWTVGETLTFNGLAAPADLSAWDIDDDKPITLYPFDVYQEGLTQQLEYAGDWVTRTTQIDADEISIDISFPRGLYRVSSSKGHVVPTRIDVSIRYRQVGATEWTELTPQRVTAGQSNPHFWGYRWAVPARGQYEVGIKYGARPPTNNDTYVDETWWTAIRTHTHETATPMPGVSMLAVRLSPTDLSNGTLDELSAEVTSIARDWDGASWTWRPTRNPASLAIHAMTVAPARRMPDEMIDWASFGAWHERCDADGLTFGQYIDWEDTRGATLGRISRVGMAVIGRRTSGLLAPHLDVPDKPVAAFITSRNSASHTQSLRWDRVPDALRVTYVDADASYTAQEVLVYGDGIEPANADDIRQMDVPGVMSRDLAHRAGRYAWAVASRRRAIRTCVVDLDTPVEVMDRIVIASDAIEHMTVSGLVREVETESGQITAIIGDTALVWDGIEDQSILFLGGTGATVDAWPLTLSGAGTYRTFPLRSPVPAGTIGEGQIYIVGPSRVEVSDWLVTQIEPEPDFRARLTCVPYAPEIYSAGTEALPPATARIISRVLPAPVIVAVRSDAAVMVQTPSGGLEARIVVAVSPVQGAVGVRTVARYRQIEADADTAWQVSSAALVDGLGVIIPGVADGATYEIILRHEAHGWFPSRWSAAVTTVVVGEGAPPQALAGLSLVVQGSMVLARWAPIVEQDVRVGGWVEWRHAAAGAPLSQSVPLGETSRGADTSAVLPYRPGAYFAIVYDRGGRPSAAASSIELAEHEIGDYSTPTVVWESPEWAGVHEDTEIAIAGSSRSLTLTREGGSTWDDVSNIDQVDNIDLIGAGEDAGVVVDSGVYRWSQRLDMGTVQQLRLRLQVSVAAVTDGDAIGLRATPVVEWPPMGSTAGIIAADIETWCAVTQDDPASPTAVWSDLFRLDSAHVVARGVGRIETRIVARERAARAMVTAIGMEASVRTG